MLIQSFNTNWFFSKEGVSPQKQAIGPLTLPHDAMLSEPRHPRTKNGFNTGYFPGGIYRYSKTFFAPQEYRHKNVIFEFEGVYMNSAVYLNGQLAGGRPYGYSNFYTAADRYLKYGQDNQIEVVVHNENEPNSRWYTGSGIYRDVNMLLGNLLHIPPAGVKITTRQVQPQRALLEVTTLIANNESESCEVRLLTEIRRNGDEIVTSQEVRATIPPHEATALTQTIPVPHPALWSVDHPNLYTCTTKILAAEDVIDENLETFGIRTLTMDTKNGLRLNGQPVKLRGACVHHDNGVIGACTLAAAEQRRVRLLRASGFNAIRSAHNPMSRAMLEACDRDGMLVMDEFSDVWFREKTAHDYSSYFRHWWESDLQAMVDKDYNHPCVILYSIGNEISETALPEGVQFSRMLADKVRSLDTSRFVTNNINGWQNYVTLLREKVDKKKKFSESEGFTSQVVNPLLRLMNKFMDFLVSLPGVDHCTRDAYATVDVAGYNYMSGRYEADGKRYPERVICGSETFPPDIAKNWRLVKKLPHVIGDFSWTGWDYLGEAGLCTWQYGNDHSFLKAYPCILADSPMIDITGHRQTQSYIHEIVWGLRKEPFIAVQPVNHTGERISKSIWRGTNATASWTWDGYAGKDAVVEVYAAAHQVELLLNGKSLGKKPLGDDFKALFKTAYQPGELTAISYSPDGNEIARATLHTASGQLRLQALPETSKLKADGADLAYINILLSGENGVVNPLADRLVTIHIEGAGSLAGFGSANPFTAESFTDNQHTTYQGRALAVIRAGQQPGSVELTLSAPGCAAQALTIPVES